MPAANCLPRPDGVDDALGAACEPLGVALHAYDLARLCPAERVAIIGGGPVGLCVAALGRYLGAEVLALSEPRGPRQRAARALGVPWVASPAQADFTAAVLAATEETGADIVMECSGAADTLDPLATARGGRLIQVGIHEEDTVSLNPHLWRRRELTLINVQRANNPLRRCLRIVAHTDLGLRGAGFFTETVGVNALQTTLERLDDPESELIKVIVDPRR